MLIDRLEIENFRLLGRVTLQLSPGANLFVGENAQGKTTLLEAVSYLSAGRSFRTTRDIECLPLRQRDAAGNTAAPFAAAECAFTAFGTTHNLRCAITAEEKSFWVDGNAMRKLGELWGLLNTVAFLPSDIEIVRGSPDARRSLLGALLARTSRYDLQTMQNYAVALRQRNALLRSSGRTGPPMLSAWEEQMAIHGARLLAARERMIAQLSTLTKEHLHHLTGGNETFSMMHEAGWPKSAGLRPEMFEDRDDLQKVLATLLARLWERDRQGDLERGHTLNGPHRADILLTLDGADARSFSSQGQARSIALAIRLAEVEILTLLTQETPVLLLDDVAGELDLQRTEEFVKLFSSRRVQALITTTDAAAIASRFPIAARFRVHRGVVERLTSGA